MGGEDITCSLIPCHSSAIQIITVECEREREEEIIPEGRLIGNKGSICEKYMCIHKIQIKL